MEPETGAGTGIDPYERARQALTGLEAECRGILSGDPGAYLEGLQFQADVPGPDALLAPVAGVLLALARLEGGPSEAAVAALEPALARFTQLAMAEEMGVCETLLGAALGELGRMEEASRAFTRARKGTRDLPRTQVFRLMELLSAWVSARRDPARGSSPEVLSSFLVDRLLGAAPDPDPAASGLGGVAVHVAHRVLERRLRA